MSILQELNHLRIPLEDIKQATSNFSNENFIGRGGFGSVYKGELIRSYSSASSLENQGRSVAVKRLDKSSDQGQKEFLREIEILSNYRHRNVVSLVGFCEEDEEIILVYEYASRGSLDKHLATTHITWVQRLRICIGAARGLNYLHSNVGEGRRVIHGDVKSSNIVLDANWEAKVCDFGLAKIADANQSVVFSSVSGTGGYLDPSYRVTGMLTKESDVYSLGVTLFEVLCGRAVVMATLQDERRDLTYLVKTRYEEGRLEEIVEPNLLQHMKMDSFRIFFRIAYQCLSKDRKERPTMGAIIKQLEISLKYQVGTRHAPIEGGYWGSKTGGNHFSFPLESRQKLRRVLIYHDNWIHSIQFTAEEHGRLYSSEQFGGCLSGKTDEINFGAYEEIIGISGTAGYTPGNWFNRGLFLITSLSIKTTENTYGPYGRPTDGDSFSKDWDAGSFAGFRGCNGWYLDGLGCYLNVITQDGPLFQV